MVERDLLHAYQGLKDTTKGEESVEDHLPTSITQGASNLHDEDMEDKIDAVAGAAPQRDRRSLCRRKNDLSRGVIPDWKIATFIVNFIDFRNKLINFPSAPLQRPCSQD